jgi:hypothetical protein
MMKISGPISAIIVSLILTLGVLFGTGAFTSDKNYATVSFDGGYKRIGIIQEERIYTNAVVRIDQTTLKRGDFNEVIEWILEASANTAKERGGLEKVTWRDGVIIEASAGIEWIGSVSNFKLSTHNFDDISTTEKPLYAKDVIAKLEQLEQSAKGERIKNSTESLSFDKVSTDVSLMSLLMKMAK